MQIIQHPISREDLKRIAENTFGDMVKCVADVRRNLIAIDAELHADLERLLLEDGSAQENLWGFNLWVEEESSFAQQMANIGSETSRVYRALVSGKESRAESSFAR